MNRTILTVAVAALSASMVFGSAAQACISCEYVPEVVNTPVGGKSFAAKRVEKKRIYVAAKELPARPIKKQSIAKVEPTVKPVEFAAKKRETAKTAPVEAKSESKPIETASLADEVETAAAPEQKSQAASTEPKVAASVGCKKFIPTVGVTVTVPCE
ncbi:hypothetical protein [Hyphomicrobium sp.]|uniref:hypothetical protein n=1 Tax=Hyphomicrobium sp. TaxID=82 RepID=UPI002E3117D6|nr:hypothetical protein [Hyphomicrobium sp.]HEX2840192.1 hypothetical protein [Hyphomicrobium sp.]